MKIKVNGLETQYQRLGSGKPLILLHGWGCSWQTWQPVIQLLADHFQLIMPDLPNFGQSAQTKMAWSTADYSQWLNSFIKAMKLDNFYLAGHSFGGKIVAEYASQTNFKHDQLQKIVLIDAAGIPNPLPFFRKVQKITLSLIPVPIKNLVPISLKHRLLKWTHSSTDLFFANDLQKEILKKTIKEDLRPQLQNIEVPALIIWGKNDLATPLWQAQEFKELIPNSQLIIFEKSAHFPFVDQTDQFIEIMKKEL